MRRQEENDRVPDDVEIDDELDENMDDDELDELDEEADEASVPVRQGEIEHADKSRSGDVRETDDRVAWTEDEERGR